MSQCSVCNSAEFTLDRASGEMKCVNGHPNYVGSPDNYAPLPECTYNSKTGEFERKEFFDNTGFKSPTDTIGE